MLAAYDVVRSWRAQRHPGRTRPLVATILGLTLVVGAAVGFAQHWLVGRPVLAAQHMRDPDGGWPAGGPPTYRTTRHPWSVKADGRDEPSVDQVRATWRRLTGRPLSDGTVLVSSRADLLATTPVHPFTSWKSIYSHPYGRYQGRRDLLRRVDRCSVPRCAWQLLRDNPYARIDGLVLTRTSAGLHLALATDTFPDGWVLTPVDFRPALFGPPYFRRSDVGDVAVVSVATGPG